MSMYIEDETTESYKRDLRYNQTKTYSQVKTESHNVKISGDLINRGTVIEVLKQTGIIQDNDRGHLVVDEINRIPTAYDLDKVEELLDRRIEFLDATNKLFIKEGHLKGATHNAIRLNEVIGIKEMVRKGNNL